jgi:hypothetical protein
MFNESGIFFNLCDVFISADTVFKLCKALVARGGGGGG